MTKKPAILALLLIFGCTTRQQVSPAPEAASAQPATRPAAASQFKNLQILPPDIPRPQLIATMRTFATGLGVRCNHCHVVTATEPEEQLDFASDAKQEKQIARVMLQMVLQINGGWMDRIEAAEGHHEEESSGAAMEKPLDPANLRVSCWTCHRGKTEPEMPPPPPARPAA